MLLEFNKEIIDKYNYFYVYDDNLKISLTCSYGPHCYSFDDVVKIEKIDDKNVLLTTKIGHFVVEYERHKYLFKEKACDSISELSIKVDKLCAHLFALMIATGAFPKDYDGEFP